MFTRGTIWGLTHSQMGAVVRLFISSHDGKTILIRGFDDDSAQSRRML